MLIDFIGAGKFIECHRLVVAIQRILSTNLHAQILFACFRTIASISGWMKCSMDTWHSSCHYCIYQLSPVCLCLSLCLLVHLSVFPPGSVLFLIVMFWWVVTGKKFNMNGSCGMMMVLSWKFILFLSATSISSPAKYFKCEPGLDNLPNFKSWYSHHNHLWLDMTAIVLGKNSFKRNFWEWYCRACYTNNFPDEFSSLHGQCYL